MVPIESSDIINFLYWLKSKYPDLKSLKDVSNDKIFCLCNEYLQEDITLEEKLEELKYRYPYLNNVNTEEMMYSDLKRFLEGDLYKEMALKLILESPEFSPLLGDLGVSIFFHWVSFHYPRVDLLSDIPDNVLKDLIREFIGINGRLSADSVNYLFQKVMDVKKGFYKESFNELLKKSVRIKKRNKNFLESVDPLNRFKTIPLHAIFLYSSQHDYIQKYIMDNWGSISSMSGDFCDIYFSINQIDYELDGFDIINQIKDFQKINITKFPCILFWEGDMDNNYPLSLKNLTYRDITELLFNVFQQIRENPILESVKTGETLFKEYKTIYFPKKEHNATINIEKVIGNVFGTIQGDFVDKSHNDYFIEVYEKPLKKIFRTLELNKKTINKLKNIENSLERERDEEIKEICEWIEDFVNENASNKSYMSKLKDFAINTSISIPGSVIANAIYTALMSIH